MNRSQSPRIIPVYVRGGPCDPTCRWCEPTQGMDRPGWRELSQEQLIAGIETYKERGIESGTLAFYGTGLLDIPIQAQRALIETIESYQRAGVVVSLRLSARPEQVQRELLLPWSDAGLTLIELEIPTLWPTALQWLGPHHQPEVVGGAVEIARVLGLEVAAHTSPGLPGSDFEAALDTAGAVVALAPTFVRITPAVVIAGSNLEQAQQRGIFRPLNVEGAVSLGARLFDMHEVAQVPVVRYGWTPTDLRIDSAQMVGGPVHPNLRALVESSRLYDHAVRLLQLRVKPGEAAVLRASPSEAHFLRGHQNSNLHRLRHRFRCRLLSVEEDRSLDVGILALEVGGKRLTLGRRERFASH